MARIRTTGLFSITVEFRGIKFKLTDTGGERSKHKKWVYGFENASIIVFVVDILAYNLVLYEDNSVNRRREDLILFNSICNSDKFVNTHMILLFTKIDIFERKIVKFPIKRNFPDFTGNEDNLDDVKFYIESLFLSLNRNTQKPVQTIFASFVGDYNSSASVVLNAIVSQLSLGLDTSH